MKRINPKNKTKFTIDKNTGDKMYPVNITAFPSKSLKDGKLVLKTYCSLSEENRMCDNLAMENSMYCKSHFIRLNKKIKKIDKRVKSKAKNSEI